MSSFQLMSSIDPVFSPIACVSNLMLLARRCTAKRPTPLLPKEVRLFSRLSLTSFRL